MNKIYPLVLALLVGAAAMAADRPRTGMITINVKDNYDVSVSVDGRYYSERDNDITVTNITPGYHNVQVFRVNNSRSPFDIFGRNNREQILWSNSVYVKPGTEVEVTINKNGKGRPQKSLRPTFLSLNSHARQSAQSSVHVVALHQNFR